MTLSHRHAGNSTAFIFVMLSVLFAQIAHGDPPRDPLLGPIADQLEQAPGFPDARSLRTLPLSDAVASFTQGDLTGSLHRLERLLANPKLDPRERTRAQFLRGWINDRLGHFQKASAAFFQIRKLEEHPLREMAAFFEARADLRRGRYRTAISECDRYMVDFPEGSYLDECQLVLADAHLRLGSWKLAISRYEDFLAEHPDDQRNEEIRLKIAEALEQSGDVRQASDAYRALFLNHRLPTTGLAAEAALRRLEAGGLELPSLSDEQLFVRACTLRDSGEVESSYELFCDLEERHPEQGAKSSTLGRKLADERHNFLWRNRRYEEVGEWNAAAYEKEPNSSSAADHLYWAVQGMSRSGHFDEAVRYQEIGRKRFPRHRRFKSSHERSALLQVGAGNYAQARKAYQRWRAASSRARRSSKVRFFTAYYSYRAGSYETAKKELQEVAERSSRHRVAALYYLGKTMRRLGDRAGADQQFQKILKEHSDSWYALVLRSRQRQRDGLKEQLLHRNGRWLGLSGRKALNREAMPRTSLQRSLVRLQDRPRPGTRSPVDPITSGGGLRDSDGRLIQDRSDPWASPSLLKMDGNGTQRPPSLAGTTPPSLKAVVAARAPNTWSPSSLWSPESGWEQWLNFVSNNQQHWPGLPTAYELSRIGLGELAGPLLSEVYNEVRKVRRKRSIKRKVRRWKASGGRRGGAKVARWAAILELGLDTEDWRDLFAAAGYPASVSHFANKATRYRDLPRQDHDSRAAWTLLYPAAFAPHVWQAGWENDVDPLLILSVMRAESLFRHDAVSRVGALGLVQVMPSTGARVAALMSRGDFRVEKLLQPETNIDIGSFYLGKLLDRFDGQFPLAVGAYNGGPHNIGRWLRSKQGIPLEEFIEEIAFDETRKYIQKVVRFYSIYADLYGPGSVVQVPAATRQDDASVINF